MIQVIVDEAILSLKHNLDILFLSKIDITQALVLEKFTNFPLSLTTSSIA